MKKLLTVLGICAALVGCRDNTGSSTDEQQYLEVARQYIGALAAQDTAAMGQLMTRNYQEVGPFYDSTYTKKQALDKWGQAFARTDTIIYEHTYRLYEKIDEGEIKGDWVMNWGTASEVLKQFPTDTITFDVHSVIKVEGDKISFIHHFYNIADFYTQLDFSIQPPSSPIE